MTEHKIYIGLNDKDSKEQIFATEKYSKILKTVCKSYRTAFSVSQIKGGYFHEDGTYVEENTLVVSMTGASDETAREIAKDLCAFFNQESVMVTKGEIEVSFISEEI